MSVVDWSEWVKAIESGVRGVPDDVLRRAASVIRAAPFVLTAGNGGSSALASHAAQALLKPDYQAGGGKSAVCLTDAVPALTAHANDGGWASALKEMAAPFLLFRPVLLLISSSGNSENILQLARNGRGHQCYVIAMTGFAGGALRGLATMSIHVDSDDYEVIEPVHDALLHRIQYHIRRPSRQSLATLPSPK